MSLASSLPETTCTSSPAVSRSRRTNSPALRASRVAAVATATKRPAPCASASKAKRAHTVAARCIAAGCSRRTSPNSPSPSRTVSFCMVSTVQEWSGSRRTTIRRTELVPMSMKATVSAAIGTLAAGRLGMGVSSWRPAQVFCFFFALPPLVLPPFLTALRSAFSLSRPSLRPYSAV